MSHIVTPREYAKMLIDWFMENSKSRQREDLYQLINDKIFGGRQILTMYNYADKKIDYARISSEYHEIEYVLDRVEKLAKENKVGNFTLNLD
ncbi:hypothetical protein [Campylobacter hominis]|uniref:hypothetical protein n=1 Tax=Campylobacter hominis TaxID=76517 RepID=UPI00248B3BF2|nr:hypothetical protein [Campylobacter hominis]